MGDNRHGPKIGERASLEGAEPHLTQCRRAEAYIRTKLHLDQTSRLVTIGMGQKLGAAPPFFLGGGSWVPI